MSNFLALILFGYLIGSISPGYFFGKIVKGIDIRKYGSHLTGAANTWLMVGPVYGVLAGIVDALKAVLAYWIAVSNFEQLGLESLSPDLAIIVGIAAVLGHNFPFYIGFRGSRGVLPLFGLVAITLFFIHSFYAPFYALALFIGTVIYTNIIAEEPVFRGPLGRTILKLTALLIPLGVIYLSPDSMIRTVGLILSGFLAFDIVRFLVPKFNQWYLGAKKFAKEKELKRLSGYTLFVLSAFLLLKFFPKEIVVASLTFFIVGDIFGPAGQIKYLPRQRILGDKTIGGAMVIFAVSIIAGLFIQSLTPLPLSNKIIIWGALLTTILDQLAVSSSKPLSIYIDDNILVPLGTASLLWIIGLANTF